MGAAGRGGGGMRPRRHEDDRAGRPPPSAAPLPQPEDSPMDWSAPFDEALPYAAFLERHGTPAHRSRWDAMHGRVALAAGQRALLAGFVRRMPVLCLAGAWCGDCVNQ